MKWYFSMDHYNYARWLSVHLFDLVQLQYTLPDVYEHFNKGHFTFQKTRSQFSSITLDQVHEQNNDIIQGVGGATHLPNRPDEAALVRWELCVHELSKVLSDFEFLSSQVGPSKGKKHHEDTKAFGEAFINDVRIVTKAFTCNPF